MKTSNLTRWAAATAMLVAVPSTPATAAPNNGGVVINEVYANGGSAGGTYRSRYYELYNPTAATVDVSGWSLQYRAAGNTTSAFGSITSLKDKSIPAGGYLLVSGPGNSANTKPLPAADVDSGITASASGGQLALSRSTTALPASGTLQAPDLVDFVGYGSASVFDGATPAPAGNATNGVTRNATHVDTDDNGTDFSSQTPTPCSSTGCGTTAPPTAPVAKTIAEVQGTGTTSPLVGTNVTVKGVVTARYTSGGFDGVYLQTAGAGGADPTTRTASDGIFVSSLALAKASAAGDYFSVTGIVSESFGLTQITTPTDGWSKLTDETAAPVQPTVATFSLTAAARESLEGMLLSVKGDLTVTNNYTTDRFGDIGLVDGTEPLDTPTNVVAPGAPAIALQAKNSARLITLDDGADVDRFTADKNVDIPWLTKGNEVRVGARATVTTPVILDFRRSLWRLQPTERLVPGNETATFTSTRAAKPVPVGGDVTIGTFNVLNYFTTTGTAYAAVTGAKCSYFTDRAGNPIAVDDCGDGPRGAATGESLARQQAKIVTAINTLGADVVSLEEIENSAKLGKNRDAALSTLVDALNAQAGAGTWAFVPSPSVLPAAEDVIRTAFIYKPAAVRTVGASKILVGDTAFDNARAPLAQAFAVAKATDASTFAVVVNHFKSKRSGEGADADTGDGQGGSNASRVAQATSLVDFAASFSQAAGTDRTFLTGDFNAYNEEDPVKVIEKGGYVNVAAMKTDKETYQFEGQVGSLDHVFASTAAFADVTGADIWNINSYESPGREYSRYNYNSVDLFDGSSPFRASDHDPELVGFDADKAERSTTRATARASVRDGDDLTVAVKVVGGDAIPTGTVTVSEGGKDLTTADLKDGAASLVVEDLAIGTHELTVTYSGDAIHTASSDTVTTTVLKATAGLTASPASGTYGTSAVLAVKGAPGASGLVYVVAGDAVVGMGTMLDGSASVSLSSTISVGTSTLTVFYGGDGSFDPTSTTTTITVAKAASSVRKVSVSPSKVVRGRTKPFVELRVTGRGFVVDGGTVTVRASGRTVTGTARDGRVRLRLGAFATSGARKRVTATFSGNTVAEGSSTTFTVKVVKKR